MTTLEKVAQTLKNGNSIAVFSHIRPDGDTIGSALAVKYLLEDMGKTVTLFCDGEIPQKFAAVCDITAFTSALPKQKYDVYFAVDCADEQRIGAFSYLFEGEKLSTALIDHHVSNTRYAALSFVEDVAATCQLIYRLAGVLGATITPRIANALMLGLSTDTGHFAHNNVTEETFLVAAALKKAGADSHKISQAMFKSQTRTRAALQAEVMGNMRFYREGKIAVISISKAQLNYYGAKADVTEGFIDYPLSVEGVEIAISMLQVGEKNFKISFRSKGKANVNQLAGVFGGGGHVQASGCMVNGYFEDVEDKLVFQASNYLED